MASTNMRTTRVKPTTSRLLTLQVLRRERISPHFARVTLGCGNIADFRHLGYDQWFRLFLPVPGGSLGRVPDKLDMVSYLKFLTISKSDRPVLRSFSVRAYRPTGPDGPELDVDLVLHGTPNDGTAGPASTWAQTCQPGDTVGILDEGVGFELTDVSHLRLVADETGLPAAAHILATLPADVTAELIIEIPESADRQPLVAPPGVEITWLARSRHDEQPGRRALAAVTELVTPTAPWFGVAIGERALAAGARRHWVEHGQPKNRLMFCGYWRAPRH